MGRVLSPFEGVSTAVVGLLSAKPPDVPSMIDLVVENIGGGSAVEVMFSEPLPINCFGIEKSDGSGALVPKSGFPSVSAGQRYVFNGGQYSGLENKLGAGLSVKISYRFRSPVGFLKKAVSHWYWGWSISRICLREQAPIKQLSMRLRARTLQLFKKYETSFAL